MRETEDRSVENAWRTRLKSRVRAAVFIGSDVPEENGGLLARAARRAGAGLREAEDRLLARAARKVSGRLRESEDRSVENAWRTRLKSRVRAPGRKALLLMLAACCGLEASNAGFRDPAFAKLPFEKWQAGGKQNQLRWTLYQPSATLSTHQRLLLRTVTRIDGRELEKRRQEDEFLALIEYRDGAGTVWQNHTTIHPAKLAAGMNRQFLDVSFYAFVLPGDYTVTAAICDPATMQHSISVRKVHVDGLRTDPLPDAWSNLPPVDVIPAVEDPPDLWYLPEVTTHLNLKARPKHPVHIRVLLNTTPSQRAAGSVAAMRTNMSLLIPAVKVLSSIGLANATLEIEFLDLTHRRVVYEQKPGQEMSWPEARRFFVANHPGIIDAATLQGQWKMRRFFWDEVSRNLKTGRDGTKPVVIVLSGPAFLEDQEPTEPPVEAKDGEARLFYIRYRTQTAPRTNNSRGMLRDTMMGRSGRGRTMTEPINPDYIPPMAIDDLEHTVEPLNARLFDAASAQQFRRVLAAVLEQISRL